MIYNNPVIWSHKKEVTLSLTGSSFYAGAVYIKINDIEYCESQQIIIPAGTIVYCHLNTYNGSNEIKVNGINVGTKVGSTTEYYYTANKDASIVLSYQFYGTSSISINEDGASPP